MSFIKKNIKKIVDIVFVVVMLILTKWSFRVIGNIHLWLILELDFNFVLATILKWIFVLVIFLPSLVCLWYLAYLIWKTITYKFIVKVTEAELSHKEKETLPKYEPAIMSYLVNFQKIGRREICSTLVDLISRNVIDITLKNGFISDNKGEYILEKNENEQKLKKFEVDLIDYLFGDNKTITQVDLSNKLYKKNLNEEFYISFLRDIQQNAKKYNFFDKETGRTKQRIYKVINKITTVLASISSFLCTISLEMLESGVDAGDSGEGTLAVLGVIFGLFALAGLLWIIKFLISYLYNVTCYYNDFSDKGRKDYKKWKELQKYLKKCSLIEDHPLMGVLIWERYYAYSIGLKCSKKFFKQMKKMKIVDNTIDVYLFETFNFLVNNIGVSAKKIKEISLDRYGGSHIDY